MKEQVCTKCKVAKLVTDFSIDRKASNGRCTHCKKCMSEYKKNRKKQDIVAFDFY